MRFALYFTPEPASSLAAFGNAVLGYDPSTGEAVPRDALPLADTAELDEITREPRRYGFHATLKAPMVLQQGRSQADVVAAARDFATSRTPVGVGRLEVADLDGFCALVPSAACPSLDMLAAECVAHFDPLRAPLNDADRQRRLAQPLSARQTALLERWGYPYVFEEFRFHMTLTGRLAVSMREFWLGQLRAAYAEIARETTVVDAVSVMCQTAREAPFRLVERIRLVG